MELYDFYRLCEDVPSEQEMDLAEEMREEFDGHEDGGAPCEGSRQRLLAESPSNFWASEMKTESLAEDEAAALDREEQR